MEIEKIIVGSMAWAALAVFVVMVIIAANRKRTPSQFDLVNISTGSPLSERDLMLRELKSEADTEMWDDFSDEELRFLTGRDKN